MYISSLLVGFYYFFLKQLNIFSGIKLDMFNFGLGRLDFFFLFWEIIKNSPLN